MIFNYYSKENDTITPVAQIVPEECNDQSSTNNAHVQPSHKLNSNYGIINFASLEKCADCD
jgi:hypothetical protein